MSKALIVGGKLVAVVAVTCLGSFLALTAPRIVWEKAKNSLGIRKTWYKAKLSIQIHLAAYTSVTMLTISVSGLWALLMLAEAGTVFGPYVALAVMFAFLASLTFCFFAPYIDYIYRAGHKNVYQSMKRSA